MSYAVSPVLCLPKNATAEFLIRFIQSAVENAEMENLRKLAGKWVYVLPRGYALAPVGNKVQAVRQQIQSGRNQI